MEVEVFTLCDAAADYNGRLSILGIFDAIFANKFPTVHPQCAVAARLCFESSEQGEHALALHVVNVDGQMVIPPLEGKVNVPSAPNPQAISEIKLNLVLNLQGLFIPAAGTYEINLILDGQPRKSLVFSVLEIPQAS
jgi:hypothetical protein